LKGKPAMLKSFRVYYLICSVIAINLSAFTGVLYMGIFQPSTLTQVISWILTIGAWIMVYIFRDR